MVACLLLFIIYFLSIPGGSHVGIFFEHIVESSFCIIAYFKSNGHDFPVRPFGVPKQFFGLFNPVVEKKGRKRERQKINLFEIGKIIKPAKVVIEALVEDIGLEMAEDSFRNETQVFISLKFEYTWPHTFPYFHAKVYHGAKGAAFFYSYLIDSSGKIF